MENNERVFRKKMTKVITYGTYDLFHYGHQRLLERAKSLGDYLIVGVTADGFDRARGKINVQQSLMERIEAVRETGLADEIIVEEYEGQKIDDIKRLDVDIFTVGSDWEGKFDYLNEYCKVVYLDRTIGVSSSDLRTEQRQLRIGLVGEDMSYLEKMARESRYVNGVDVVQICSSNHYTDMLTNVDAVYLYSRPQAHYQQIKQALLAGKHVLCESPLTTTMQEWNELYTLAEEKNLVLMDAIRTAYAMAYNRLLVLVKSGVIGKIMSIDATCTSLRDIELNGAELANVWNSICSWGPNALLPIFQLLGTCYKSATITSHLKDEHSMYDTFTHINITYSHAIASVKVGKGMKSEGELIISGTDGYIYVPAPWWKTEYFEIRREDSTQNKRYFYQLDGEGIRYELVSFLKQIRTKGSNSNISKEISLAIIKLIEEFYVGNIIQI